MMKRDLRIHAAVLAALFSRGYDNLLPSVKGKNKGRLKTLRSPEEQQRRIERAAAKRHARQERNLKNAAAGGIGLYVAPIDREAA